MPISKKLMSCLIINNERHLPDPHGVTSTSPQPHEPQNLLTYYLHSG
jgi:hypothetical protein